MPRTLPTRPRTANCLPLLVALVIALVALAGQDARPAPAQLEPTPSEEEEGTPSLPAAEPNPTAGPRQLAAPHTGSALGGPAPIAPMPPPALPPPRRPLPPPPPLVPPAQPAVATVPITVQDAATGQRIPNATVTLSAPSRSVRTDQSGSALVGGLPPGTMQVTASAGGYFADTQSVTLAVGEVEPLAFYLSSTLPPGQLRIVLTWQQTPRDLDAHLWVPTAGGTAEVDFLTRGSLLGAPYAHLEADDSTGMGPETITLGQTMPGPYTFAVYNFSNESPLAGSGARARVYGSSGLLHTFTPPAQGVGRWWTVFTLQGGQVAAVNRLGTTPPLRTNCDFCPSG